MSLWDERQLTSAILGAATNAPSCRMPDGNSTAVTSSIPSLMSDITFPF
jgi:hypothetical protein